MIRRLRRRHLRIMVFLAVIIPAILFLALGARRPFPHQPLPAPLTAPVSG